MYKPVIRLVIAVAATVALTGCTHHARHAAVVVDTLFVKAVAAVDDAETAACKAHTMSAAACAAADPKIAAALLDARAVTVALQHTPTNVAVPKNLPDLLTDLTAVQAIIAPLAGAPGAPPAVTSLAAQVLAAINETITVVKSFTGGE